MKEHKLNSEHEFIQGYYIDNSVVNDNLIKWFESSKGKRQGTFGNNIINKEFKNSTDLSIHLQEIKFYPALVDYFNELEKCLEIYKAKYIFCHKDKNAWQINESINIQKYKPSQAYHKWHCEKANLSTASRHLVFMTYLNDVKKGGETEFYHQKLKVKPEKGLTLIWGSDWTFTHRGLPAINEDKYIITGWYNHIK